MQLGTLPAKFDWWPPTTRFSCKGTTELKIVSQKKMGTKISVDVITCGNYLTTLQNKAFRTTVLTPPQDLILKRCNQPDSYA